MTRHHLVSLIIGMMVIAPAYAGMQELDSEALSAIEGQGGADLSLVLRLNQKLSDGSIATANGTTTGSGSYSNGSTLANDNTKFTTQTLDCTNRAYCRLAAALNNRVDGSGNPQWLVMKGWQGYINVPKIGMDAVDLFKNGVDTAGGVQAAFRVSLTETFPILIRHLGFESLSIETDNTTRKGYLALDAGGSGSGAFDAGKYTAAGFDNGREVGFTGLDMHGNLNMNNQLLIFSCPGTASTRC